MSPALWLCLALAVLMRAPLLPVEPTLSDDIYRYVWDGRVQGFGVNPYLAVPADPGVASLHTAVTRKMNHPGMPTLYPPFSEWVFRGIASIRQSVFAFKLTFVVMDLLIIGLLLRWLSRAGQSPWRVLVYAWNPLVVLEVAGSGHLDIIGVLLIVVSFLAFGRRATWLAALAFVGAVGVKFLPIVLVPLFWGRVRVRHLLLAAAFALVLVVPFVGPSMQLPVGSLSLYLEKWRFNGFLFGIVESLIAVRWLTALPVVAGLAVAIWFRTRLRHESPEAWAWAMGAALFLAPCVYPWYLLWLVPFLGTIETLPLLVWTQSSLVTYYVWRMSASGAGWRLPWWATAIEFGTVAAAAVWAVVHSRRRASEVH